MLFGLVVKIVSGEDRDFRKSRRSRENFQLGECQLFSEDHFSSFNCSCIRIPLRPHASTMAR